MLHVAIFSARIAVLQCQLTPIRLRSIYHNSNMARRLLGQTFIFGVVFLVAKSFLGNDRQKKL